MIIAGSGHRPPKLGGYGLDVHNRLVRMAVDYMERERPDKVITGMAPGWDLAWGIAAFKLDIPLCAAVPFDGQQKMWPEASQKKYLAVLSMCTEVIYVCTPGYTAGKMKRRNQWMMDRCDRVAALWDGSPGGTSSCLMYADVIGRPIDNLWSTWREQYSSAS